MPYKKGERQGNNGNYREQTRHLRAVQLAYKDILNGGNSQTTKEKLMNDEFGLGYKYGEERARHILKEARDQIKADFEDEKPTLKETMVARYLDLYSDCRAHNDRMTANSVLKNLGKIVGLEDNKVTIDGTIKEDVKIVFGFGDIDED